LTKYIKVKRAPSWFHLQDNRISWKHVTMTTIRTRGNIYFCMSDVVKTRSWLQLTQQEVKRKIVDLQSLSSTEFVTLIKKEGLRNLHYDIAP
jgi:hypothetical protein